jgi:hypothetical protein
MLGFPYRDGSSLRDLKIQDLNKGAILEVLGPWDEKEKKDPDKTLWDHVRDTAEIQSSSCSLGEALRRIHILEVKQEAMERKIRKLEMKLGEKQKSSSCSASGYGPSFRGGAR